MPSIVIGTPTIEVTRWRAAFELTSSAIKAEKKNGEPRSGEGYYFTRRRLVDAIHEAMGSSDPPYDQDIVARVIEKAGLGAMNREHIRFYVDPPPNNSSIYTFHVFHSSTDHPAGKGGHGHAEIAVSPDGQLSWNRFYRPEAI